MASCIESPSSYRWSISACLHFPSVMRAFSCAWPGCEEEAEETLTAAAQSRAAVPATARALAKDDAPPCCVALPFVKAFASSSDERMAPSLLERLTVAEGESTAMVYGRMRGSVRRERRANGGRKGDLQSVGWGACVATNEEVETGAFFFFFFLPLLSSLFSYISLSLLQNLVTYTQIVPNAQNGGKGTVKSVRERNI